MSSWQEYAGIASGVLAFLAAVPYIRSILRGQTKPDRAANTIWAVTSAVSFFAYRASGAEESAWFAFGDFIVGIVMLGLAIRFGYGWVKRRNTIGLLIAAAGLVLWAVTDEPFLALLLSVGVDAVGSVLVAIKSYEAPDTEHLGSWVIYLFGAILAILSIDEFTFAVIFYPAYAAIGTSVIIAALLMGRRKT